MKSAPRKNRKPAPERAPEPDPPSPGGFTYRLNTVAGVRREICRLYREARTGGIAVADASRLGNLLFLAARLLEGQELDARVRALEEIETKRKERFG
jgi:hypothetical protein